MAILLAPFLVVLMAVLGMGAGLIVSSMTTKYRDLKFVISFGMQLLMYLTPVIYPVSLIPEPYRVLILWNPMAHIIESFKYAFLGTGSISFAALLYTFTVVLVIFLCGVMLFNKVEQDFIDTV